MHRSIFSYSLTRPYPYPWFTWVVIIGGLIATALLTVINIAANGYESSYAYESNLTKIEHEKVGTWYENMPWSLASKVKSSCQDQVLQIGSKVQTSTGLLQYEIERVHQLDHNQSNATHEQHTTSAAYHGETLENCDISRLRIDGKESGHSVMAAIKYVFHHNNVANGISLNLSFSDLLSTSNSQSPSSPVIILGSLLLKAITSGVISESHYYWLALPKTDVFVGSDVVAAKIIYTTSTDGITTEATTASTMSGLDLTFPSGDRGLSDWSLSLLASARSTDMQSWSHSYGASLSSCFTVLGQFIPSNTDASTVVLLDTLAKIYRSVILSDLGQSRDDNIFSNIDFLWESCKAVRDWFSDWFGFEFWSRGNGHTGEVYSFNDTTRQDPVTFLKFLGCDLPHVQDSSIDTLYLCESPKTKSTLSLIIAVMVSDFVLLSAIWTIFTWLSKLLLERQDPNADKCVGCTEAQSHFNRTNERSDILPLQFRSDLEQSHRDSNLYQRHEESQRRWFGWLPPLWKLNVSPRQTSGQDVDEPVLESSQGAQSPVLQFSDTIDGDIEARPAAIESQLPRPISSLVDSQIDPLHGSTVSSMEDLRFYTEDRAAFWSV